MNDKIELLDQKRSFYTKVYFISLAIFTLAWVPRLILKSVGALPVLADRILLVVLALTLPFQLYSALGLAKIAYTIKKDPNLRAALYNELYLIHDMKAWKYGFFSTAICLVIFSLLSVFIPLDIIPVAMTALWTGIGGYHISFYYLDRG